MSASGYYYQRLFNTVTEATDIYNSVKQIDTLVVPDASASIPYSQLNNVNTTILSFPPPNADFRVTSLGNGTAYSSVNITAFGSNTISPGIQASGFQNLSGNSTIGIGYRATQSLLTPPSSNQGTSFDNVNIGIGTNALQRLVNSSGNIAIGNNCMLNSQFTQYNTAIGNLALLSLRDSSSSVNTGNNTSIGNLSLLFCASGTSNTVVGNMCLHAAVNASGSIAIGKGAVQNPFFVSPDTIALGYDSLCEQVSGAGRNIALGYDAMCELLVGENNLAIGSRSMYSCVSGSQNVYVAAYTLSGGYNISGQTVYGITGGNDNVIIGNNSANIYNGNRNLVIGHNSLVPTKNYVNSPALFNVNDNLVIGSSSLTPTSNYFLKGNTIVGNNMFTFWDQAQTPSADFNYVTVIQNNGNNNTNVDFVTSYNVTMGPYSGLIHFFGGANTIFGARSWVSGNGSTTPLSYTNSWNGDVNTIIGALVPAIAFNSFNYFILGNSSITTLRCQVALSIVSDGRDKLVVGPMTTGLDFITKLRTVTYRWNNRDANPDLTPDTGLKVGIIAQEVKKVIDDNNWNFLDIVDDTHPEKYKVKPVSFLPPMAVSLQELKSQLNDLHNRMDKLSST